MAVRIVRTQDEAAVKRLHSRLFPDTDFEGKGNAHWLAFNGKAEPVGFASIRQSSKEPDAAYLSRCGVIPDARGHGLQRRLIRVRCAWALREGYPRVVTYCVEGNIPSARNLVRCGFLPYKPSPLWVGKAWYFEKELGE